MTGWERRRRDDYSVTHVGALQSAARKTRVPPAIVLGSIGFLELAVIGSNSLLGVGSVALLVIGSALLWRPGKSPILLFVFGYQWLQISIGIFYADWLGLNVNELSEFRADLQTAATLSLIGLFLLGCGMRLGAGKFSQAMLRLQGSSSGGTERKTGSGSTSLRG